MTTNWLGIDASQVVFNHQPKTTIKVDELTLFNHHYKPI
jgi:hypothetical protein